MQLQNCKLCKTLSKRILVLKNIPEMGFTPSDLVYGAKSQSLQHIFCSA